MAVTTTLELRSIRSEFGINTFTSNNQLAPDLLGLRDGGFVVAYNNSNIANGFILLDFYDAAGEQVGIFEIPYSNPANTDAAGEPSLTQLANGNVLVVWDENSTAVSAGMRGALFTSDGTVITRDINITPGSGAAYANLDTTALEGGGFVVSYNFGSNLFFQIYNDAGQRVGGSRAMNTITFGSQTDAQVAALDGGGFVAVWTNAEADEVKFRRFDSGGVALSSEVAVAGGGGKSQASVAALEGGGFAVVYRDTAWSEGGTIGAGITLQVFNADGGDTSGIVQVNTPGDADESDPDVAVLDNGFILVTWTRPASAANGQIMGRLFDAGGTPLAIDGDGEEFIITSSPSDDILSTAATLLDGRFITAWQDSFTGDGSGGRITAELNEFVRRSTGDAARDRVEGDGLRDLMDGGDGADTLSGAAADDTLRGGRADDTLLGGEGDDLLEGGARQDSIDGGAGDDLIYSHSRATPNGVDVAGLVEGGLGDDTIFGGSANDKQIFGDAGEDVIFGGGGDDELSGGFSSDVLDGGEGNDTLFAFQATAFSNFANTLRGGAGDDRIFGEDGADLIEGGDGDDRIRPRDGGDTVEGGLGIDTVIYDELLSEPVFVDLAAGTASGGDAEGDVLTGVENVTGSSGADILRGDAQDNELFGSFGADTLEGRDGDDELNGGRDADLLIGGRGADVITPGGQGAVVRYQSFRDSLPDPAKRDLIQSFFGEFGQRIDLALIDARQGGADNAFRVVSAFTGAAGQLVLTELETEPDPGGDPEIPRTFLVEGDITGDGAADFAILVESREALTAADFIL